mmetsp:Transcript_25865/g.22791  ORF Transcript_25865/g.22791 Transcript_25865/m.22791 type:complete len:369 (-) Transcript_25865:91-1197(-)
MSLVQQHPPGEELTVEKIRNAIPKHLFHKSELRFLVSVAFSVSLTLVTGWLAYKYIPLTPVMIPIWVLYALANGTIATGVWVLGHECGHGAFSESKLLNDALGFVLHTVCLVPYFSWQHSHFVHHSRTNHLEDGETHVPSRADTSSGKKYMKLRDMIGDDAFAIFSLSNILIIGWPAYLIFGATGGPSRGFTSHFFTPNELFPKKLLPKVIASNVGLAAFVYFLYYCAQLTSGWTVFAVYLGPYLVVNMYLTGITFLQHTEADVPHYDRTSWNWLKGALCTIDRNYPAFINALQFDIGSTHVLHHIFSQIPHYNAPVANEYLKQFIGKEYRYDDQPFLKSLYRCATLTAVEHVGNGEWRFVNGKTKKE